MCQQRHEGVTSQHCLAPLNQLKSVCLPLSHARSKQVTKGSNWCVPRCPLLRRVAEVTHHNVPSMSKTTPCSFGRPPPAAAPARGANRLGTEEAMADRARHMHGLRSVKSASET